MNKFIMLILVCCSLLKTNLPLMGQTDNPLLKEYDTPFGVPPFDQIREPHILEAYEFAMQDQLNVINEILNQKVPTFENAIEALENSSKSVRKVSAVFYNLLSANTNSELQDIAQLMAPMLSQHNDNIYLNADLYAKIREVETNLDIDPTPEQKKLLTETIKKFVRSGADLSEWEKDKLKALNSEMALASVKFGENVLNDINEFKMVLTSEEDLAGLPESVLSAAKIAAVKEGLEVGYLFTISPTSMQPFLQYSERRDLRQKLMQASLEKGNTHPERMNAPLLQKLVEFRAAKANMLGYSSHAHFVLEESMAKNPDKVISLLDELWKPALSMATNELSEIVKIAMEEDDITYIEPWDWAYYTEKLRKQKFDLSDAELRPYFELEQMKNGMFTVLDRLWGLKFIPISNIPVYHEEVQVYEVTENDGTHIGVIFMDFHPRASKKGGAWMSHFRKQMYEDRERVHPIVTIVCNFTRPTDDKPALLTLREVETMYHEMGHAIHGLLSNVQYASMSGTSVPHDFVELPSQVLENWINEPLVLKEFALHYETQQPIPDDLLNKLEQSKFFNMGFKTVEYLAASMLDMRYHSLKQGTIADIFNFEKRLAREISLPGAIPYRYRSTYFNHIFSGGYSSGYYSYIWSEILDADAFAAFKETGNIFDRKTADKFRKYILEPGGTEDPMELYKKFRGMEPDLIPLLERRGLN